MKKTTKNAQGPMDIAEAKEKTSAAESSECKKRQRTRKHKLAPGQHPATVVPVFTAEQQRILDLLATGSSVAAAAEAVGCTYWAVQKWIQRDEVFKYYAARARGIYTVQIGDAFHEVETDARIVLHEIIRDHNIAPHIRLRASLAALRRKADEWLPRPLTSTKPIPPPPGCVPPEQAPSSPDPAPTSTAPDAALPAAEPSEANPDADNSADHADNTESAYLTAYQSLPAQTALQSPATNFQVADSFTTSTNPYTPLLFKAEPGPFESKHSGPSGTRHQSPSGGDPFQQAGLTGNKNTALFASPNRETPEASPSGTDSAFCIHAPEEQANQQQHASPEQPPQSAEAGGSTESPSPELPDEPMSHFFQTKRHSMPASPVGPQPNPGPGSTQESHRSGTPPEDQTMRLDTAFLSKYTVLRHEKRADFARLLSEMTATYEPQSRAEELQVLRITQAHWNLRRLETMQTAVFDSVVTTTRAVVHDAHPAAAIAVKLMGQDPASEVWFLERLHNYRKIHEDTLARQENLLFRLQDRRNAEPLRHARLAATKSRCPNGLSFPEGQPALTRLGNRTLQNQLTPLWTLLSHRA